MYKEDNMYYEIRTTVVQVVFRACIVHHSITVHEINAITLNRRPAGANGVCKFEVQQKHERLGPKTSAECCHETAQQIVRSCTYVRLITDHIRPIF